ncbi:MAG: N-acetyl-gamma-glutamyl-phosphate reductase, partial [Rhodothermales bacterium]|nr:N-acetyl-gamma-glutamyl-phosphate reductase [Rhodothermales bacterium]
MKRVAILHGAGYTGGELVHLVSGHPYLELTTVTSRSFAGQPVAAAHPALSATTDLKFTAPEEAAFAELDGVFVAAEHGQGASAVLSLLRSDFDGVIVDLSADFRFGDPAIYPEWFGFEHPAPALLEEFVYGLPE